MGPQKIFGKGVYGDQPYVLSCWAGWQDQTGDAESEHQEVKDKAEELWTDEVKTAWTTFQAEQEANQPG